MYLGWNPPCMVRSFLLLMSVASRSSFGQLIIQTWYLMIWVLTAFPLFVTIRQTSSLVWMTFWCQCCWFYGCGPKKGSLESCRSCSPVDIIFLLCAEQPVNSFILSDCICISLLSLDVFSHFGAFVPHVFIILTNCILSLFWFCFVCFLVFFFSGLLWADISGPVNICLWFKKLQFHDNTW